MYLFLGILFLLFLLLLLFFINLWRKKRIIKKICSMCMYEKCDLLNDIIEPFGYSYVSSQDLFTSRLDAWQREFGYCALYDRGAFRFNMIFDCLPVYFDCQGKTWLIEFWKGQYGINTGCEIGIYYADRILQEGERKVTLFRCVEDNDMLKLSFYLIKDNRSIAHLRATHWWLTAFDMGCFSNPDELMLRSIITFPSCEMAAAFLRGLCNAGYDSDEVHVHCNTVTLTFRQSAPICGRFRNLQVKIIQRINRFWCHVYLFVTRPFCLSVDRILYLYYYLPFAFRKMLRLKRYKKYKPVH